MIEGRNAVLEALKSNAEIDKIFIKKTNNPGSLIQIKSLAVKKKIPVIETDGAKLDSISETKNHQGVIAYNSEIVYADIEDILKVADKKSEPPLIIIVDGITDPRNLGAIIRSAEAFGAHGVIIPKRRASGVSAVVAKTSAGAVNYIPICRETNLTSAVKYLKSKNIWAFAADPSGTDVFKLDLTVPLALVIGSEGSGVSRLVKENCDFIARVPMFGKIDSLNASVAAGAALYEIARQRTGEGVLP
jgi:23S rRNA (guanosine2251-2'-O)-methyltransferase